MKKVLLVEDDLVLGSTLKNALDLHDWIEHVEVASNYNQALELLMQKEQKFDLFFIDLDLFPGKNGLELAQYIRRLSRYRETPILSIGHHPNLVTIGQLGHTQCLKKPADWFALDEMIESLLKDEES